MKCKACKEGTLTFDYSEDGVIEVWKCSTCDRKHKLDTRTEEYELLAEAKEIDQTGIIQSPFPEGDRTKAKSENEEE